MLLTIFVHRLLDTLLGAKGVMCTSMVRSSIAKREEAPNNFSISFFFDMMKIASGRRLKRIKVLARYVPARVFSAWAETDQRRGAQ